jgi:serine protease Do
MVVLFSALITQPCAAGVSPDVARRVYSQAAPSLVAVQYVWESEAGRQEMVGAGIVITTDGVIMTANTLFDPRMPDSQLKDFKVIVPSDEHDADELDATFLGRDERTELAFLKVNQARSWQPIRFESHDVNVGDVLLCVGLLPESEAYRAYLLQTTVSAMLRGDRPYVLADGGLGPVGSPVFNADGQAIGFVPAGPGQPPLINARSLIDRISNPPRVFVPASDFIWSLKDLPEAGKPRDLPWLGVVQLNGLTKDVAEQFGLKDRPAVEVGDVIAGTPADKAGLVPGDKIVGIDGQPLPRGDQADDLGGILRRLIMRRPVGSTVTLSILRNPDQPPSELTMQLAAQPPRTTQVDRYFAEDLGFTARELVFTDRYARRMDPDDGGVIVAYIKPQSAANHARMEIGDVILWLNRQPVKDLAQFRREYQQFRTEQPAEPVVLVVLREGQTQTIRIEAPR